MQTITEINDKISRGCVVVRTAEELKAHVAAVGVTQAAKEVDVITTGTFEPMEQWLIWGRPIPRLKFAAVG